MVEIDGVQYVSGAELTQELGITRQTLWRWRSQKKIPSGLRFRDRQIVFSPEEVEIIRQYALRLEPAEEANSPQMQLFDASRIRRAKGPRS